MRELEIQREIQLEKLKLEQEERISEEQMEREERMQKEKLEKEQERQYNLRMKELEMQDKVKTKPLDLGTHFDVTKHIRLVPPFQEKEVDKHFLHFEKVAENLKRPKEHWTLLLQSVVIGKAREIYTQLSLEQSSDYDKVKELILKAYELVPEAYRQKFGNCRKENDLTHVEFARTKEQLFDRWCSSKKIGSDYLKLFTHLLVLSQVLVSNLVIPIRMLPNPNLLVKTKVTIPYLSLFAIIANNQVILFLIVLF